MGILGSLIALKDCARILLTVYLHRLVVIVREMSGLVPFEPLSKCPRHVCLAVGPASRVHDVEKAVKTLIAAGVERVTVSHDGSLGLSCESFTENVTMDMGKSNLVKSLQTGKGTEDSSNPDVVLILLSNGCFTRYTSNVLQLPKCIDASFLYYSELIPVYSLNPSDVFLSVSMFQSKSQRFGR
jgi:hypothetical protein